MENNRYYLINYLFLQKKYEVDVLDNNSICNNTNMFVSC